ncbi:GNAT family protein [Flaviaesturariibacter amylovorans]|uniref:GNAT family protein n=1 Tax=Flaviaesturariibacter amylovorans TaxID=1084520 RepID=A0ABP8GFN1_9BACT
MIRLAYFTPADFDQLIAWVHDEYLLTNWAGSLFRFPLTRDSLEWYLEDTNDLEKSDALVYKAIDEASGETVGHVSLGSISRKNHSARISRVLVGDTQHKGRGICTEMIRAVLRVGFGELNLHRISLGVYDFNKSAIRCYEKAGFVSEGVQRDILRYGDEYWSLREMSILSHEWKAMQ